MKTNGKQIRGFLLILLVAQIINLGLFKGLEIGSNKLAKYIYSQTAEPFLALNR